MKNKEGKTKITEGTSQKLNSPTQRKNKIRQAHIIYV